MPAAKEQHRQQDQALDIRQDSQSLGQGQPSRQVGLSRLTAWTTPANHLQEQRINTACIKEKAWPLPVKTMLPKASSEESR